MKKHYKTIIIGVALTLSVGGLSLFENKRPHRGVEGKQTIYDEVWELEEDETIDEFVISLGEGWKEYSEMKYVPDIPEDYIAEEPNITIEEHRITNIGDIRDIGNILNFLNPHKLNYKAVTAKGWNMRYGVTQISLKLVPLATYFFDDFENNPTSQVEFLKKYIDVKSNKGKTMNQIMNSYMKGEDF